MAQANYLRLLLPRSVVIEYQRVVVVKFVLATDWIEYLDDFEFGQRRYEMAATGEVLPVLLNYWLAEPPR